ncbi:hypothetical protein JCM33374_g2100 [Metschnikowia sp. JCM 33374]|nr:hypothetical protein JCM33374_g2100 [Metschnikowia sp. JCM 33374]
MDNTKAKNREKIDAIEAEMARLSDAGSSMDKSSLDGPEQKGPSDSLRAVIPRGPDYVQYTEMETQGNHFQMVSSVLSLRQPFTKQPFFAREWVLQFNGELYNNECLEVNDTSFIMDQLKREIASGRTRQQAVSTVIEMLDGEFAYVLTDTLEHKIYFGKDSVGKRSLLFESTPEKISVSSVFPHTASHAVECKGNQVYVADLSTYEITSFQLNSKWPQPIAGSQFTKSERQEKTILQGLHDHLQEACEKRQSTIYPLHPHSGDARIGILFSGGLDCTVLAAVIAKNFIQRNRTCLIDLLTVGFDNPRTGLSAAKSPDRVLSEQSWYELTKLFYSSGVQFRLVQIDVSYAEWLAHKQRARQLIYPCSTEMDLSIAIAFYFATRATNCELLEITRDITDVSWSEFREMKEDLVTKQQSYSSCAKVLFSGLGADELFGGYSRHENIFHGLQEDSPGSEIQARYDELAESLVHDINVIYERNLGRDDRAMSSWGKELRYPYLDRNFVKWVIGDVSPQMKVSFEWVTQRTKKGEKRAMKFDRKYILRRLAENLGLHLASKEIKRAIQFGAKSAKMEVGQQKARGTDVL